VAVSAPRADHGPLDEANGPGHDLGPQRRVTRPILHRAARFVDCCRSAKLHRALAEGHDVALIDVRARPGDAHGAGVRGVGESR